MAKPMRVLICGVPNVGKSTLINTLKRQRKAKTGDEAGITKLEQRIMLADDFYLWDTPGMLWPRIIVDKSGYNLAASGAVGRNAYDEEEVALELLDYLRRTMRSGGGALQAGRAVAALRDEEVLDAIGRKRGALLGKGRVNLQKAAEIVMNEFRSGNLGASRWRRPRNCAMAGGRAELDAAAAGEEGGTQDQAQERRAARRSRRLIRASGQRPGSGPRRRWPAARLLLRRAMRISLSSWRHPASGCRWPWRTRWPRG